MATLKSQEDPLIGIFIALLRDVSTLHSDVFNHRSLKLTIQKVVRRYEREGVGFLTKTLPRHGKAFDRALTGEIPFILPRQKTGKGKLPKLFGELYELVFDYDGRVRLDACPNAVRSIRQLLYLFYKYELPYCTSDEQAVLDKFKRTEQELVDSSTNIVHESQEGGSLHTLLSRARMHINNVLWRFDPYDIHPRHGPGAVSTRETLETKYRWTNIPERLTRHYPIDAYFMASFGHVCDEYRQFERIGNREDYARFILVPKDSRGPRGISAEPLVNQWIQQGISRSLVRHLETHPFTRNAIHFTDQTFNANKALEASLTGAYSTLDLNEASDRISSILVKALYPPHIYDVLMATRSQCTYLPTGELVPMVKFAPMGSALCFPILALSIWALLKASGIDDLLVYGDDVIVPTPLARNAIAVLESVGLKVNTDKSCTSGFFRESCGMDAFRGVSVTPVRIRTVWQHVSSPDVYTSWISYANSFYERRCFHVFGLIADMLHSVYGDVPDGDDSMSYPCLRGHTEYGPKLQRRVNHDLQKTEVRVRVVVSRNVRRRMTGWEKLLRYFSEGTAQNALTPLDLICERIALRRADRSPLEMGRPFSVCSYTKRRVSKLAWRWR